MILMHYIDCGGGGHTKQKRDNCLNTLANKDTCNALCTLLCGTVITTSSYGIPVVVNSINSSKNWVPSVCIQHIFLL